MGDGFEPPPLAALVNGCNTCFLEPVWVPRKWIVPQYNGLVFCCNCCGVCKQEQQKKIGAVLLIAYRPVVMCSRVVT